MSLDIDILWPDINILRLDINILRPDIGCLKKTEFSGYAGCDGCDGPMEGGRGLTKNIFNLYIQIQKYNLFKYGTL